MVLSTPYTTWRRSRDGWKSGRAGLHETVNPCDCTVLTPQKRVNFGHHTSLGVLGSQRGKRVGTLRSSVPCFDAQLESVPASRMCLGSAAWATVIVQ